MNQKNRILVVDDNRSFRKGMRVLLDIQPDMKVVGEAATGQKALEMTEKLRPDLVLLDVQMPGMNGVELTRQIKLRWPQTKIILMTMYPEYDGKAIEVGADAFLTKGIPPDLVLVVIRGIIKN